MTSSIGNWMAEQQKDLNFQPKIEDFITGEIIRNCWNFSILLPNWRSVCRLGSSDQSLVTL